MNKEKYVNFCYCCSKFKNDLRKNKKIYNDLRNTKTVNTYPNGQTVGTYWQEIIYNNNEFENSILWGTKWANLPSNILTYTINLGGAKSSINVPGSGNVGLVNVSQSIIDSVNTMMNDLTKFTNLKVQNVGINVANAFISINFLDADNYSFDFLGIAMPPVNSNDPYYDEESNYRNLTESFWASGNTYIAYKSSTQSSFAKGGFWYDVMMHELGHSLGLAHPHDNGGNSTIMAGVTSAFGDFGTYNSNLQPITCMSYNDTQSPILQKTINGIISGYMGEFGPLDIQALQYMYGINPNYNSGNTIYTFPNSTTNKYWSCIYDTDGIDTIDASQAGSNTNIDIQNSTLQNKTEYAGVKFSYDSFGGITIAKSSAKIENVIGSAQNDNIKGNDYDNEFDLSAGGNDTVDGKKGFDTAFFKNTLYSDITFNINSNTGVITITKKNNSDVINLVNVEKIVFLDKIILISNDIIEVGTTQLNHIPKTITLNKTFINPIVCCGDPSFNNSDPCVVRITKISSNSFTMFLKESPERDGLHNFETVSWVVGEKGVWNISNDKQVIFDTYNSKQTTKIGFEKIKFATNFRSIPIIISQVASYNGNEFIVTRTKNINKNSFECAMQEAENLDNIHAIERIDWCAFSPGAYTFNGKKFECRPVFNVNHNFKNVAFTKKFFTKQPKLLIRCSSFNDSDPVNTRVNISLKQPFTFIVKLQEDTSKDSETNHLNENVNFIAIE
jgi:hypothetical protein